MKEKIWFAKTPLGKYLSYSSHSEPTPALDILASLLSQEIRVGDNMKWVNDPGYRAGNASHSYTENSDLLINMEFFDDMPPFRINKDLFLKLVKAWMEIYPQYPDRIDLTQEDNRFTFEFDTKDGHQVIVIK